MSTVRQPSALLPDGTIDVNLIEREIRNDLTNDMKYRAEDGMKKRAIHTSKNYDEFRAFVSCAELRPVNRSDVRDLFQSTTMSSKKVNTKTKRTTIKKTSSRQQHATTKSSSPTSTTTTNDDDNETEKKKQRRRRQRRPRNGDEFAKEWHGRRRTLSDKISYLTASLSDADDDLLLLPPSEAPTIFRIDIDATIMSDIIKILHVIATTSPSSWSSTTTVRWLSSSSSRRRCRWMFDWLEALTDRPRFSLSVEFLSAGERDMVTFLIYYLSEELFGGGTATTDDGVGGSGGEEWRKTEEDWKRLKSLYKV